MQYYWDEISTIIKNLLVELHSLDINLTESEDYLEHNELGLSLESAVARIVENDLSVTKSMKNLILMCYYQMGGDVSIFEEFIDYEKVPELIGSQIDGGWVVAISTVPPDVIEHFRKEFSEEITSIVLVKYTDCFNELFLNSCLDSVSDNQYSNALECILAIHKYGSRTLTFSFDWKFNDKMFKKW